jgi:hypothetical protein
MNTVRDGGNVKTLKHFHLKTLITPKLGVYQNLSIVALLAVVPCDLVGRFNRFGEISNLTCRSLVYNRY